MSIPAQLLFNDLMIGDRFNFKNELYTTIEMSEARKMSKAGFSSAGFLGDCVCFFEGSEIVRFVPVLTELKFVACKGNGIAAGSFGWDFYVNGNKLNNNTLHNQDLDIGLNSFIELMNKANINVKFEHEYN